MIVAHTALWNTHTHASLLCTFAGWRDFKPEISRALRNEKLRNTQTHITKTNNKVKYKTAIISPGSLLWLLYRPVMGQNWV